MTSTANNNIADEVFQALTQVLIRSGKKPPQLGPESLHVPLDNFDLDSMDKLEFVMTLEDSLGKVFDANKIVQCKTLADIVVLAGR